MSCFHTCGPNEVMVVYGLFATPPRYVIGGSVWVFPCIQRVENMSLNTITLEVVSPHVYTKLGIPVSVIGIAQVKIARNEELLSTAATLFLSKSEQDVHDIALATVEGHQRAMMGELTVEEIYRDRDKFSDKVLEVSAQDLLSMGLEIVSYTIKSLHDDLEYLESLGKPRTEQVKRDARIGEAEAHMNSNIKVFENQMRGDVAKYQNEQEIARAKRDFELQNASYAQEVELNKARADLAYQLQAAKTEQAIREEEVEVKVIERAQAVQIMQQETARRERELDATVKRPADAEKYRLEKAAGAERQKLILEAQANAEALKLRGEADAFALKARGQAEAEQMGKKAEAWKTYTDAAKVEMIVEAMPKLATELSQNLIAGMREKEGGGIKMIGATDGISSVGPQKLTDEMLTMVQAMPQLVERYTGVDITVNAGL